MDSIFFKTFFPDGAITQQKQHINVKTINVTTQAFLINEGGRNKKKLNKKINKINMDTINKISTEWNKDILMNYPNQNITEFFHNHNTLQKSPFPLDACLQFTYQIKQRWHK